MWNGPFMRTQLFQILPWKSVGPVLKHTTKYIIFNLLGPLVNPCPSDFSNFLGRRSTSSYLYNVFPKTGHWLYVVNIWTDLRRNLLTSNSKWQSLQETSWQIRTDFSMNKGKNFMVEHSRRSDENLCQHYWRNMCKPQTVVCTWLTFIFAIQTIETGPKPIEECVKAVARAIWIIGSRALENTFEKFVGVQLIDYTRRYSHQALIQWQIY